MVRVGPTVAEVAGHGCVICRRPAAIHHVPPSQRPEWAEKAVHRDDRYVLPLCPEHHQWSSGVHNGRESFVAAVGKTEAELLEELWGYIERDRQQRGALGNGRVRK